jgi:ABC-type lipoprotein export system ATPase subunit
MRIRLENIVPVPLAGTFSSHPVWGSVYSLEKGQSYLVRAFSGKGKTTLLNILYGSRRDFSGKLLFNDKNSAGFSREDWAVLRREKLSAVFQDLRIFPRLTARENIQVKLSLNTYTSMAHLEMLAERLGIAALLDRPCFRLSFGQQQRLVILRALCQPFDWLLLDEPFSHLDPENIQIVCGILKEELAARKAGLVLSTLDDLYPFSFNHHIEI